MFLFQSPCFSIRSFIFWPDGHVHNSQFLLLFWLPLTIKHRLIPLGCFFRCCSFFFSFSDVLIFFTNHNNRHKVTNYWHWSVSAAGRQFFPRNSLGLNHILLAFVLFLSFCGFQAFHSLSLLRCLLSLLSGCFFLRSHINFMSICAVPVIIHLISWILIQWEWERMCKFVSFPKWAHYMLGMSMIFAIILLFIAIFFKIIKTMKPLYWLPQIATAKIESKCAHFLDHNYFTDDRN